MHSVIEFELTPIAPGPQNGLLPSPNQYSSYFVQVLFDADRHAYVSPDMSVPLTEILSVIAGGPGIYVPKALKIVRFPKYGLEFIQVDEGLFTPKQTLVTVPTAGS